ncbi:MAG: hypothetical protein JNK66_05290 [Chitinophagales bacterium]|nr:hypothetical protein [Chitinophagales bacterium]
MINVLLYALLCALFLRVLSELLRDYNPLIPFIATLIYAAHPIHTEVVASIKNRDEILAFIFSMAWLIGLTKFLPEYRPRLFWHWWVPPLLLVLAILTKSTSIVSLPICLLLATMYTNVLKLNIFVTSIFVVLLFFTIQTSNYSSATVIIYLIGICAFIYSSHAIQYFHFNQLFYLIKSRLKEVKGAYQNNFINTNTPVVSLQLTSQLLITTLILLIGGVLVVFNCSIGSTIIYCSLFLIGPMLSPQNSSYWFKCLIYWWLIYWTYTMNVNPDVYGFITFAFIVSFENKLNSVWYKIGAVVGVFLLFLLTDSWPRAAALNLIFILNWQYPNPKIKISISAIVVFISLVANIVSIVYVSSFTIKETIVFCVNTISIALLIIFYLYKKDSKNVFILLNIIVILVSFTTVVPKFLSPFDLHHKTLSVLNAPLPTILDSASTDRPILTVESVTDALSPMENKLGTAAQVLTKYAKLLVIPYPMSFYYGYKIIEKKSVYDGLNMVVIAIYVLLGVGSFIMLRFNKIVGLSGMIIVIGLSIYTNVFAAAPGMMADRFLFVPSLGFCILLAYGLIKLFKIDEKNTTYNFDLNLLPTGLKYSVAGLLLVYSVLTFARNTDWKDHLTLFAADIGHLENSAQANNLYAVHLMKNSYKETDPQKVQSMRLLAEQHFKQAIHVYPEFFNAQYDLARTQSILAKNEEAEHNFVVAAKMNPDFPTAWLGAAEIAMNSGRYSNAVEYFSYVPEKYRRDDANYYLKFSYALYLNKQIDSSLAINKQGATLFPQYPDFYLAIGQTFLSLSQSDSAIVYYEKALTINPANTQLQQTILQLRANKK